ncbi:hypothetical protein SUDANB15_04981 [Streptomyces sp. enrichment culture]
MPSATGVIRPEVTLTVSTAPARWGRLGRSSPGSGRRRRTSRRSHALRAVVSAAPASLAVGPPPWPVLGASSGAGSLARGAASGVASAAAFALLHRTPTIGPMDAFSPVTAPASAVPPVGVGPLQGEHLGLDVPTARRRLRRLDRIVPWKP